MTILKQMIIGKKMTQSQIAVQLGISKSAVSQQAKNGIKNITVAKRYAKILNCNPLFLLETGE